MSEIPTSPTRPSTSRSDSPTRNENALDEEMEEYTIKEKSSRMSVSESATNGHSRDEETEDSNENIARRISTSTSPVQGPSNESHPMIQRENAPDEEMGESAQVNVIDFNIRYPNMKRICKRCGELGHIALGCLNAPKAVCYHCGMSKSHSDTSWIQEKSGESVDFITRYPRMKMKCKNCGDKGHVSIGCLNQHRQICYQCGEVVSHSTAECDLNSTGNVEQIIKSLYPCSFKYVIFVVNTVPTTWLIDSGAAISFIKNVVVKELKLPRYKSDMPVKYTDISGAAMTEYGVAEIPFKLGNEEITHTYVIGGNELKIQSDGLLGIDFVERFKCVIDYNRNRFKICGFNIEMEVEDTIVNHYWTLRSKK